MGKTSSGMGYLPNPDSNTNIFGITFLSQVYSVNHPLNWRSLCWSWFYGVSENFWHLFVKSPKDLHIQTHDNSEEKDFAAFTHWSSSIVQKFAGDNGFLTPLSLNSRLSEESVAFHVFIFLLLWAFVLVRLVLFWIFLFNKSGVLP